MSHISFDIVRDQDGRHLRIPLQSIPHGRMPPDFDQYRRQNGVYVIVDRRNKIPVYVGESHADRLIHTATRHIQNWNLGPTWDRKKVMFGFILCSDGASAYNLQNLIIAELVDQGVDLENNLEARPEYVDYESDDTPF